MPNLASARTNKPLTNASIAYMNKAEDFVWFDVAPQVLVTEKSGSIYSYGKQAMRIVDTARATYGGYNKINLEVSKADHYYCDDYGLFGDVSEEDVADAEAPIVAQTDTAEVVLSKFMLDQEKKIADVCRNTSIITQNVTLSGTDQWDDYTNSDPVADIRTGINTVEDATGKVVNRIVMGRNVARVLVYHPAIKAYFPGAIEITFGMIMNAMAKIFGVERVSLANTKYTDTNEGASTETLSNVWGNDVVLIAQDPRPTRKSLTFMNTFVRRPGLQTVTLSKAQIGERAELQEIHSMVGQKMQVDQVIQNVECAYLIKDAI